MPFGANVALGPTIQVGNDQAIRTGPQFSFDVGHDEVRFIYTVRLNDGDLALATSVCTLDLQDAFGCNWQPGWGTGASLAVTNHAGVQFNPVLKWAPSQTGEYWQVVYQTTDPELPGTVAVRQALLDRGTSGQPVFRSEPLVPARQACPSLGSQYWGDYDDLQQYGRNAIGRPLYVTAFTQSYAGCDDQQYWDSHHVHVGSIVFP